MSISVIETNATNILSNIVTVSNSVSNNKVNINFSSNSYGSFGNIINNTSLATLTNSSSVNVSDYGYDSHFYYEDSNNGEITGINIEISIDDSNWDTYTTVYPSNNYDNSKRVYSGKLNLNGISSLRIRNLSTITLTNIYSYIIS